MAKQEKKKKGQDSPVKFGDFLIPIVSGVIFLILLFFNFIPTVQEVSSTIEETEKIKQKQIELEERIQQVKSLDYIELQNALSDARRVVPNSLEVAEYAHYVHRLAAEKDLKFVGIKAEDDFTPFLGGIQNIRAVQAPLQYRGSFEDITEFFNDLQGYSPYVVSMEEIELRKIQHFYEEDEEGEDNEQMDWMFEITVAGYYFAETESDILSSRELIRLPFTPYFHNNEEVVQTFGEKARRLETGGVAPVN